MDADAQVLPIRVHPRSSASISGPHLAPAGSTKPAAIATPYYGLASNTRLNGVCVARRNLAKPPPSTTTLRSRASPAWAPSAGPFDASDAGTQIIDEAP